MNHDVSQVHTVKDAPKSHLFEVSGTVLSTRSDLLITLPVYTRRVVILKDGRMVADAAFIANVVQHPRRFLLAKAREPIGDVEFSREGLKFRVVAEESALLMSRAEAEEAIEQIAKGPSADIEEELTLLTMEALSERMSDKGAANA